MPDILVISSSGLIRYKIRRILEKDNHNVYEIKKSQQLKDDSINIGINKTDIDLILFDHPFEDDDNFDLLKYIFNQYYNIPVFVISSDNRRTTILEAFELGVKDYILKPFGNIKLLNRTNDFLPNVGRNKKSTLFERDYVNFKTSLSLEINRSIRSKNTFALGKFESSTEINIEDLQQIKEEVTNTIRELDQAYVISEDIFILLLPLTDRNGFEFLVNRLKESISEVIKFDELMEITTIVFPEDITEKLDYEKIDNYKKEVLTAFDLVDYSN